LPDVFTGAHRAPIILAAPETTYWRSMRILTLPETVVCSPTDTSRETPLALPSMWIAFCAARSRAISRCSFRPSSRWS
jgi:hypothetical protein